MSVPSAVLFSESPIVLQSLNSCLEQVPGLALAGQFCTMGALISCVRETQPQMIILDFDTTHSMTISELHYIAPHASLVLWTRELSVEMSYGAVKAGVRGVLPKSMDARELSSAVARVAAGELYLDSRTCALLLTSKPIQLTKRETQLVRLLTQGLKNKEIAFDLNITEGSVKIYLSRLYAKTGAQDRYELALYGLRHMGFNRQEGNTVPSATGTAAPTAFMMKVAGMSTRNNHQLPL